MTRQILITIADDFRELDVPDLLRDLSATWGVVKAEYIDGPRPKSVNKPSRPDLDDGNARTFDLAALAAAKEVALANRIEPDENGKIAVAFHPDVIEAARQAAAKAEGVSVDDVPVSKPRKGKRK